MDTRDKFAESGKSRTNSGSLDAGRVTKMHAVLDLDVVIDVNRLCSSDATVDGWNIDEITCAILSR